MQKGDVKMSANDILNIQISNDVISTIASVAALEVDGVSALSTLLSSNIKDLLSKKNTSKGIVVEVSDNGDVAVTVNMIVKYNYKFRMLLSTFRIKLYVLFPT